MAELTITCTCGRTHTTDDARELDGVARCDCGATYAYALTQLSDSD